MQIPRSQNMVVDEVAKLASSEEGATNMGLMMEVQKCPSIEEVSIFAIQSTDSWMTPSYHFSRTSTSLKISRKLRRSGREQPYS